MSGRRATLRGTVQALLLAGSLTANMSGCSSGGPSLFQRIGDQAMTSITGAARPQPPELTRADLDRIQSATIAISSQGGPRAYLVPLADNGGYLDYRDADGNSVVMLGGSVAEFESAGNDLDGMLYDRRDPIAHPTPLADWPAEVWREYQYSVRDHAAYVISLDCIFERGEPETIDIVELTFNVTRVREICTNARRQVTNTYWVDAETGFTWKSEQWLGPKIGPVTVEIIRPYGG